MTQIAKCGTPFAPHVIYTINGVGRCNNCDDRFVDNVKQDEEINPKLKASNLNISSGCLWGRGFTIRGLWNGMV